MKAKAGLTVAIVVLLGVLGVLLWFLFSGGIMAPEEEADAPISPTAAVSKGSIIDKVTGAAEVKPSLTENLKMAKYTSFKAFVAPLDTRIAAGTPLVEYTNGKTLVAPYDLVVRSKNLPEKKNDALDESHYVQVSRVDLLHVDIDVGEADISRLVIGQKAQITFGSDENKTLEGSITKINEVGTYNATGSKYRVTIEIPNDGTVLIGMSANASITVDEVAEVLRVPVSAIVDTKEGPLLTLLDAEGGYYSVPVETGLSDGTLVEVRGDIAEGDMVLLNEAPSSSDSSSGSTGFTSVTRVG